MLIKKIDILQSIFLTLAAIFLVFDLFIIKGEPATFDGRIHITNIAQYYQALQDKEFPVRWANGIANFGLPTPLLSQQATNYTGALLTDLTHNPLLSYKLLFLIGSIAGSLLLYWFLRIHVGPFPAGLGALLFTFAPYRIFDIYVRGDLPEFFASAFIPLLLIGIYFTIRKKNLISFILLTLSSALIILSHPFVFLISMFVALPYGIVLLISDTSRIKSLFLTISALLLGFALSSWYTIPLLYEIKYFYLSKKAPFVTDQFLALTNYMSANWTYGTSLIRENFIQVGIIQSFVMLIGAGILLANIKAIKNNILLTAMIISGVCIIFLTSPFSYHIYTTIKLLGNIQFPWRMLVALDITSAVVLAIVVERISQYRYTVYFSLIIFIALLEFPGLYGKNYIQFDQKHYFFTHDNPYSIVGNPIWSDDPLLFPVKTRQASVIDGPAVITNQQVTNSKRFYTIDSTMSAQMVDYTFYFPGWNVRVDNTPVQIQFQDPGHRGLVTYPVPAGKHTIQISFEDTKDRILGNAITVLSAILVMLLGGFILIKKLVLKPALPKKKPNKERRVLRKQ